MADIPTRFEEAVVGFKTFLAGQSHWGELRWVFLDDVAMQSGTNLIRFPIPDQNEVETKLLFEAGVRDGHGMGLDCFARHEGVLFCFIRHTLVNDTFGLELMPGTLRYSCDDPLHPVRLVNDRIWRWTMRSAGKKWLGEIPKRDSTRTSLG